MGVGYKKVTVQKPNTSQIERQRERAFSKDLEVWDDFTTAVSMVGKGKNTNP